MYLVHPRFFFHHLTATYNSAINTTPAAPAATKTIGAFNSANLLCSIFTPFCSNILCHNSPAKDAENEKDTAPKSVPRARAKMEPKRTMRAEPTSVLKNGSDESQDSRTRARRMAAPMLVPQT